MANKAILIGRVGQEPEVYHGDDFTSVKFSFATSKKYKNKNNERVERTMWHNIVIYRKLAEIAEKYVKKGDLLYLEGEINYRMYESDGVKKYITEIIIDNMEMLGSPKNTEETKTPKEENEITSNNDDGDDLPF